jgi:hypothetical protein
LNLFCGGCDLTAGTRLAWNKPAPWKKPQSLLVANPRRASAGSMRLLRPDAFTPRAAVEAFHLPSTAACFGHRLARMIGDWYLRKTEKHPNEVQTI